LVSLFERYTTSLDKYHQKYATMIEDIINNLSVRNIVVGFLAVVLLLNVVTRIADERRILALGYHTRYVRNYLPYSKPCPVIPTPRTLDLPNDVQS
jgi:hypothetical protein